MRNDFKDAMDKLDQEYLDQLAKHEVCIIIHTHVHKVNWYRYDGDHRPVASDSIAPSVPAHGCLGGGGVGVFGSCTSLFCCVCQHFTDNT